MKWLSLLVVLPLVGTATACRTIENSSSPAIQAQSADALARSQGRLAENAAKTAIAKSAITVLTSETSHELTVKTLDSGLANFRPVDLVSRAGVVFALDNLKGELIAITSRNDVGSPALEGGLRYPMRVRGTSDHLYVSDSDGLKIFGIENQLDRRIRSFYATFDFVALDDGRLYINPMMRDGDEEPIVVEIDRTGKRQGSWSDNSARIGPRVLRSNATLTTCGNKIIVALVYEPTIFILGRELTDAIRVDLPYPGADALRALAARSELTSPTPGFHWLPTFLAGVACGGSSIYVLADLPVPYIFEVGTDGQIKAPRLGSNFVHGRHVWRLIASKTGDVFYTIATSPELIRTVTELTSP